MKTEVYSWRVSTELKQGLEREARRRKTSVSALLDAAARDLLTKSRAEEDDEEEQRRLHAAVAKCIGTIEGDGTARSENVSALVKAKLRQRYGR